MLDELERILVQLYDSPQKARSVIDRAQIPFERIDMSGAMRDVWHGIVAEADAQGRLRDLVKVAADEYSQRKELQQIYGAFVYGIRSEKDVESMVMSLPPRVKGDGDTLARLEQLVAQLDSMVFGSKRPYIIGLAESNQTLVVEVQRMREDIAKLKDNQQFNRRLLIFLGATTGLLVITVIVLIFITRGGAV